MESDSTPLVFEETQTQDSVNCVGRRRWINQAQTTKLSPLHHPLSVGNGNWAEVFVIKYVRGNSRKWTSFHMEAHDSEDLSEPINLTSAH